MFMNVFKTTEINCKMMLFLVHTHNQKSHTESSIEHLWQKVGAANRLHCLGTSALCFITSHSINLDLSGTGVTNKLRDGCIQFSVLVPELC